ncbi:hypothetical protein IEO70_13795 [Bacillus sp. AGMB 02131]|uniref:Swarming motility protein SwrB n=1 Tax=Peribacillus faecalis TaxID=2772559 RepID=A0A927HCC7_9BACI|nr:hypothetical protein [Peribacillus faecalis]MBD3109416.1 hypothetical protein [Peribacillus faecalis]
MTLVLIISFILHAFSIFAIIILYLRQNKYIQAEQSMEKLQKDVEAVIQSFLLEIQEENKQLSARVENNKNTRVQAAAVSDSGSADASSDNASVIETAKVNLAVSTVKKAYHSASDQELKETSNHYEPPMPDVEDQLELSVITGENKEEKDNKRSFKETFEHQLKQQSSEERAVEMMKNGYNIEDIAKELGKGKTEIELLLKFHS